MKRVIIIIVFLFTFQNLFAQDPYGKYKKAYAYIDSISKHKVFNVCPIIGYIPCSIPTEEIIAGNMKEYEKHFPPFIDNAFDSIFNNKNEYAYYLCFSHPIKNILTTEFRTGHYNVQNFDLPYYDIAVRFIFKFDENENIVKADRSEWVYE